jgi:hypothetical protein
MCHVYQRLALGEPTYCLLALVGIKLARLTETHATGLGRALPAVIGAGSDQMPLDGLIYTLNARLGGCPSRTAFGTSNRNS